MPFTNAYALVVGIANYERINRLPPTVLKDAQDIRDALAKRGIDTPGVLLP